MALRQQYGWAGGKLSTLLSAEGVSIAPATVDRIIQRRGLTSDEFRHRPAVIRFERPVPNDLWQIDHKGEYRLAGGKTCIPLSFLDDHSRFAVGLHGVETTGHEPTERSTRASFEEYGLPSAALVDHGVPWWSSTSGFGLTRYSVMLIEYGITLHYSGIRHPQTQGKVERFHRTLKQSLLHRGVPRRLEDFRAALADFRQEYNEIRPHEALGMAVPTSRYRPSQRRYTVQPEPWEYPVGAEVKVITSAGLLDLPGERHFVSQALAGKAVRIERFANRILVSFRHMLIREIDRTTGESLAVVLSHHAQTR